MAVETCSVAEYQIVVGRIDYNGVVAVHFLGKDVFAELVEYQTVYGSFHGACAELGVIAFVGQKAERGRCHFQLDTGTVSQHALYRGYL